MNTSVCYRVCYSEKEHGIESSGRALAKFLRCPLIICGEREEEAMREEQDQRAKKIEINKVIYFVFWPSLSVLPPGEVYLLNYYPGKSSQLARAISSSPRTCIRAVLGPKKEEIKSLSSCCGFCPFRVLHFPPLLYQPSDPPQTPAKRSEENIILDDECFLIQEKPPSPSIATKSYSYSLPPSFKINLVKILKDLEDDILVC